MPSKDQYNREVAKSVEAPAVEPTPETPLIEKSSTPWRTFERAGLGPSEIVCAGYKPTHPYDQGCHTRLPLKVDSFIAHTGPREHGGGFFVTLKEYAKPWPGWKELEDLGVECMDLRCDWCQAKLPVNQAHIRGHMKAHGGKFKSRGLRTNATFNITISLPGQEGLQDADTVFESQA